MHALTQHEVRWLCPNCSETTQYSLHRDGLQQRKRISIRPILPTCTTCGADIRLLHAPPPRADARLIVLTGTCASGKSSTAEALIAHYGFTGIDGNCVLFDVLKHKYDLTHVAFNGPEMLQEIAFEIDLLLALHRDIVLSQVIIPSDLPTYRTMFQQRKLCYRIFVLQPQYATAVARSQQRTVFQSPTLVEWVKHFHDAMACFQPEDDVEIFDNTDLSVEASAAQIWQSYQFHGGRTAR